jgi:hypothetical protein
MKRIYILIILALLSACSTTSPVKTSEDAEAINALTMSCKKPYILPQDCSIWSGATRKLEINGFVVKVGASDDGKTVLVMDARSFRNTLSDPFTLNSKTHSTASNNSYHAIRKVFDENDIEVLRVRPLKSFGNINGYVLELKSDGYSLLKTYTKK